jgi:fatty-acid desaturase
MQDKHVWLAYSDFSKRAENERAFRHALDDALFHKNEKWYIRMMPLLVIPAVLGGFCIYFLGLDAMKMFIWSLLEVVLIMGIIGLTKLYELSMYSYSKERKKKAYRQMVGDKITTDMKFGYKDMDDHFFNNYEVKDQRFTHSIFRFLPHVIELTMYYFLFGWLFSQKAVWLGMIIALPTLLFIMILLLMTRAKLPKPIERKISNRGIY